MTAQIRVLFVDDEPRVLDGLKRALRAYSETWSLHFASSPEEALATFGESPFDVVVSDLAMPGMNGIEMVLKMRQMHDRTAFIMLTGTADLPHAVAAINQAQVFRFFTKPCATPLLVEGIEAALADQRFSRRRGATDSTSGLPGLTASLGLAALNRVAFGVMVVDSNCRVLLTNRAGGEILALRDGLTLGAQRELRASTAAETARLHDLIGAALRPGGPDEGQMGLAIDRPSLKRPFMVLMCASEDSDVGDSGPLAVVFVSDPERQALPDAAAIGRIFGLTPSEARLVHALTQGMRIEDAARHCGVTTSTARTYLKQIFVKTDTSRQPELVKLVLTSPALAA